MNFRSQLLNSLLKVSGVFYSLIKGKARGGSGIVVRAIVEKGNQ